MSFNSLEFLIFFPLVTFLYYVIPHRWRWVQLLLASCIFYMYFIPAYLLILVFTILVDYLAGIAIGRSSGWERKAFLLMSIIANLGVLAVFKYAGWISTSWQLILPIGLSFHTFQAMSYTIEVYRGRQAPERHLGYYALYVLFYPQLVAGPIERPYQLLPQLRQRHPFKWEDLGAGLRLMLWGFFKKLVIADRLAGYVNYVYEHASVLSYGYIIVAVVFFSFQVYCDFSGYTDIAIGAARTMGIDLMSNFRRPYFASNIRDFWSRWHISLTSWFRDYVYIPLGGNRVGRYRRYFNVMLVFLLSGLWHGAGWNFLIWGGLHGLLMVGWLWWNGRRDRRRTGGWRPETRDGGREHDGWRSEPHDWRREPGGWRSEPHDWREPGGWRRAGGTVATFCLVSLAWIFFRCGSLEQALGIFRRMFGGRGLAYYDGQIARTTIGLSCLFIVGLLVAERYTTPKLTEWRGRFWPDVVFGVVVLTGILLFGVFTGQSFIYFQF